MPARVRKTSPAWRGRTILAVGHSTLPAEDFVALLAAHGVRTLADIRTIPKSRTNPQFAAPALKATLKRAKIRYVHIPELGGRRRPRKDSPNTGWRNMSFRGYADHMQTEEFEAGLQALRDEAACGPVAMMCAESLRWRCHRSLTSDALFARGVVVQHIVSRKRTQPHAPTPFARIRKETVTYPPALAEKVERERATRRKPPARLPQPQVSRQRRPIEVPAAPSGGP